MMRPAASGLAPSASSRLAVSIRPTTRKLTRLSSSGTSPSIPPSPPSPPLPAGFRLSVLLVRTGPLNLKHVGGAADESGERAAQQDHHTAGTRSEDIGTESQANG